MHKDLSKVNFFATPTNVGQIENIYYGRLYFIFCSWLTHNFSEGQTIIMTIHVKLMLIANVIIVYFTGIVHPPTKKKKWQKCIHHQSIQDIDELVSS